MGQTGSGKSHFLETLVKDNSLGISKDELDGGTQEITAYKIRGLQRVRSDIYFIDIPGFSNPNTSELKIVDMIRTWVDARVSPVGFGSLSYILYFHRITVTRATASKMRLASLFKELLGTKTARSVTIVTTMWDELKTDLQRERANARFEQLKSECWKDILNQGAKIVKFQNTQESAFAILRDVITKTPNSREFAGLNRGRHIRDTSVAPFLQESVSQRILAKAERLNTVNEDLKQQSTVADPELHYLLLKEKSDLEVSLERLKQDWEQCAALPPSKSKSSLFGWLGVVKTSSYVGLSGQTTSEKNRV